MENKTALFYMYGANINDLVESESLTCVKDFEDPDVCDNCGGDIKWKDDDFMSLQIKGTCKNCKKEVILNE